MAAEAQRATCLRERKSIARLVRHSITPAPAAAMPEPLQVFGEVPGWAIVHAAEDNRCAPLIRKGEVVVVESNGQAGWYPVEGGLFLIEYVSAPIGAERYERRTRSIVQTHTDAHGYWYASGLRRGLTADGAFYCSDGPYSDELQLADKLIGKVLGLYSPASFQAAAA